MNGGLYVEVSSHIDVKQMALYCSAALKFHKGYFQDRTDVWSHIFIILHSTRLEINKYQILSDHIIKRGRPNLTAGPTQLNQKSIISLSVFD